MMSLIASIPTSLPVTDPVLIFAIVMLILLIAPLLIKLLRVPALIGLIAAGMIIGPNVLGVLDRDPTIILLGTVGLLYIMFLAGLEVDLNEFAKAKDRSAVFGFLTFAIPQATGIGLGLLLDYTLPAAILLGSLFASHTLIPYPLASQLKIHKTESSTMAVGGTIITNFAGLLVLAVIAGSASGELNQEFWITLGTSLTIYTTVVLVGLPRLGRWFFSKVDPEATAEYVFVMAALFVCSFLATVAQVEAIIGAFLAGLTLNRLIPESSTLMNRINFVGNALFIPFFLLSVGMLIDPMVLVSSVDAWIVAGSMTGAVIVTKFISAKLSQWIYGYSNAEGWVIFGLTVPQAAATLAAVIVGFNLGLFDEVAVNGIIIMILVTCIIGLMVVQKWGVKVAEELKDAPVADSTPHRIMIPLLQEDTEMTLELAFALRGSSGDEALYPVTVVAEEDDSASGAQVARAEKLLAHAVNYMAGADVNAMPMTRLASDPASGIKRAAIERRISDVILPWDGRVSKGYVFGRIIDVVLTELKTQILVARIQHPVNTTQRVVVLIGNGVEQSVGFDRAVKDIKQVANQLGAMITIIALHEQVDTIEAIFQNNGPSINTSCVGFDSLELMLVAAGERMDSNDIAIALLPRPNSVHWNEEFNALPARLPNLIPKSFVVMFPSEIVAEKRNMDQIRETLEQARFHLGLQEQTTDNLVRHILDAEFHLDHELPRRMARIIGKTGTFDKVGERGLVVSAHDPEFPCDVLIIATSDTPVQLSPIDHNEVRIVGMLLSCKSRTQREHQQKLQELTVAIGHLQNVPGIFKVYDPRDFVRQGSQS